MPDRLRLINLLMHVDLTVILFSACVCVFAVYGYFVAIAVFVFFFSITC